MKKNLTSLALVVAIGFSGFCQWGYAAPVNNPFDGAVGYVNPDYVNEVNVFFNDNPTYKDKVDAMGLLDTDKNWKIPTAIWLDSTDAIKGQPPRSRALSRYLDDALDKYNTNKSGGKPIVLSVVIYDLPLRDCDAYSSNGQFKNASDLAEYKKAYIDEIRKVVSAFYEKPNSDKVRLALIIEPDSIPNLITNMQNTKCSQALEPYTQGISYALEKFSTIPNSAVSMYLDIAHSGWLGWDANINKIPNFYNNKEAPAGLGKGFDAVRGFITNTSNYTPLQEAFTREEFEKYENLIKASDFYSWNGAYDEASYIALIAGLNEYSGKHFLTDTSRNGWIPQSYIGYDKDNKSKVGATYTRLDQRHHRGNWCNAQGVLPQADYIYRPTTQQGAIPSKPTSSGFGRLPEANPSVAHANKSLPIDALVWIKPPGEGDGFYEPTTGAGDQMCGALPYIAQQNPKSGGGSHNDYQLTDSLQDNGKPAPPAGHFFPAAFKNLIDASICIRGIKGDWKIPDFCSETGSSSATKK